MCNRQPSACESIGHETTTTTTTTTMMMMMMSMMSSVCNVAVIRAPTCQSTATGAVRLQRDCTEDEQYRLRVRADTGLELYTDLCTATLAVSLSHDCIHCVFQLSQVHHRYSFYHVADSFRGFYDYFSDLHVHVLCSSVIFCFSFSSF